MKTLEERRAYDAAKSRKWRAANPSRVADITPEDRERRNEQARAHYAARPNKRVADMTPEDQERRRERGRAHYAAHPEKYLTRERQRRLDGLVKPKSPEARAKGNARKKQAREADLEGIRKRDREAKRQARIANPEEVRKLENAARKRWAVKYPDKAKERGRKGQLRSVTRRYGISLEEYHRMLVIQDGKCAICGNSSPHNRRLGIDHNHVTGRVRELLCVSCNAALGGFRDNPALLRAALEYLAKHTEE